MFGLKTRFPVAWRIARTSKQAMQLLPRLYGYHPRTCPLCGNEGKFHAEIHFPDVFTYDAVCPKCGSLPRNRLIGLAVNALPLIGPNDRLLHFAPEDCVRDVVSKRAGVYKTADLNPRGVDLQENIEKLSFAEASWDVIICSHVLEHVDHRAALRELFRVLAPGGRLLALFPVVESWSSTYENASVTREYDRAIHFGKENHLRRFGGDVRTDFADAGFVVEKFCPIGEDVIRYGLIPGEVLYIARKPA